MNITDVIRFRRLGALTIAAVYLVILAGSVVRASGAGMGCPDWPTCFGCWIPPTQESQLPADYHAIYAARGYANTDFNPVKTWTEYANRVLGAGTGLLIILTTFSARRFLKSDATVFWVSAGVMLLTGFQGWLGSAVVASNLRPAMITAHMATAFIIVCMLIYAITRSQSRQLEQVDASRLSARVGTVLKIALVMTLLQIAMGTQIRESVDLLSMAFAHLNRHLWREEFPLIFYVHRSFSSLILLTNLWIAWQIYRHIRGGSLLFAAGMIPGALIICAIASGVVLDRLGFPAFVQPIHLLLANLIFGAQFFLLMTYHYARRGP
ncbi:heme A synthase [Candidatus Methylospira mobilis]|uniref:Heme A synthase n=1 Tax=Candidatus Methylospira mobilis TaxID=1808979 RepID=A0A5Q0BCZ9_9GAMM|nr:COX15/CtaA family protein [Candidatus Methylospira mobilis]QFY41745.1 heme A synthase [Candidatus Methylospira mobilis]WNV06602.1 COX15/CtaA family protein [Candidatus Methylospira mobilis]